MALCHVYLQEMYARWWHRQVRDLWVLRSIKAHMTSGTMLWPCPWFLGYILCCVWGHGITRASVGCAASVLRVLGGEAASIDNAETAMLMRQWHDITGPHGNGDLTWSSASSKAATDNACQLICLYKQPACSLVLLVLFWELFHPRI